MEKEVKTLWEADFCVCESVEISGKSFYAYFYAYHIKDVDRLADFATLGDEVVSGTIPHLVARVRVGDKLIEYYEILINDIYGGELYLRRLTQDRPCRKHGVLYISYHENSRWNYVFFYREDDEFGDADEFDYLCYREMMLEMGRYVEEGEAEILYLSERKYDPVEYMALVEDKEWAKERLKRKSASE
jgi:hypothetical protein